MHVVTKGIFSNICPLLSADDVSLLGDNTDSIKKNAEPVTDASRKVALEINIEKTKYKLLSRHQNAGQNRDIKVGKISYEKCGRIEIFWNGSNKLKLDTRKLRGD
jgi:hypothetical protein